MKKYNVNVNGTAYEVTVEEVVGGAAPAPVAAAPAAAPAPAPGRSTGRRWRAGQEPDARQHPFRQRQCWRYRC